MRAKHGLEAGKYRIVWAPIDEISPLLVFAVVRSEDPKFFKHRGVAWNRMALALYDGFAGRGWKGAEVLPNLGPGIMSVRMVGVIEFPPLLG